MSFSMREASVSYFLNMKIPKTPEGIAAIYFLTALYPLRRRRFLFGASLERFLGAIKEILAVFPGTTIYLKVKKTELMNFPCVKMLSTVFVSTLSFLGSI